MKFTKTEIAGVFDIAIEPHRDARGFFARAFCPEEFAAAGIAFASVQMNISRNDHAFTLRGMHWQDAPFGEAKVVRATSGAAYDVVIDLRPGSATFRRWITRTLTASEANALFIPEGCAHGFLTLEPATDIFYQMGRAFVPGHARGFRWDDPAVGIEWPHEPKVIAPTDENWPAL